MLKKSLFAIALLALITVTVQADDVDDPDGFSKFDDSWPSHIVYEEVEICRIPIRLDVGYFAEIVDCSKKYILLEQVSCSDIGKGDGDFPCYSGCVELSVKTNFDAKLGATVVADGPVLTSNKGKLNATAEFSDEEISKGGEDTILCVNAWNADIFYEDPTGGMKDNQKPIIGEVAITIKPNL